MRRSVKLAAVVLSGSLGIASLAACGAKSTDNTTTSAGASGSSLKVGMAYDIGGRGDQSFNDSAARGLDKAKTSLGVQVNEAEAKQGESDADKEARLNSLVTAGFNPVIAVGFVYQSAVEKVAKANPNVKFAIIDSASDTQPSNVTSLTFSEQEGSFLAGVAAASKTKYKQVGFIGGVQTELIKKFEAGYRAGVQSVDPSIKVDVKYLTTPPDFTGFADPAKGKSAAQGMLDNKDDVIYTAAGSSGSGAIEAVATDTANKNAWAIGVDSDQASQPALSKYKDHILTSMVKNVDTAVYTFINSIKTGSPLTGVKNFDLKQGGVSLATTGGHIDDIKAKLDEATSKITSGATVVPTAPPAG
ncbi:BMP family ABC transporter substrate-binding protein [Streptomyces tateyamensis]|uniref:BMP family ABC transporter substrate-binding protein n=1 Tax=Streptomyces tateyamensis TaxID=565073 RepID=A0A2V4ND91_9ACTN|nr:BMP family ABC transporter substrate-binding protein [Streptomyces tateyamensis]PYC78129.1 BMP family ABC transporter substrate-binding protein [Streptomyces tateyamensis]